VVGRSSHGPGTVAFDAPTVEDSASFSLPTETASGTPFKSLGAPIAVMGGRLHRKVD